MTAKLHSSSHPGPDQREIGTAPQGIHDAERQRAPPAVGEGPHREHPHHVEATHQAIGRGRGRG